MRLANQDLEHDPVDGVVFHKCRTNVRVERAAKFGRVSDGDSKSRWSLNGH